jgi:hypothetical protein
MFADEAGNFDFSRKAGASRYYILVTLTCPDYGVGDDLQALRRELGWEGVDLDGEFHATTDRQAVRDRVFEVLARHEFRVDATILEKAKARPETRPSDVRFYQSAWFYHMRRVVPLIREGQDDLFVMAAAIGTSRRRSDFHGIVKAVMGQVSWGGRARVAFWPSAVDPCLQAADYCAWAIQRRWERGDERSYALVSGRLRSEVEVFRLGTRLYY